MTDRLPAVYVFDDLHPEDNAMLQALYSRSPSSVVDHLEKVKQAGSGKFMSQYYINYGHASIGDCGSTTIFVENVSMLVAKAIQDNPLYSGQEASTRYLDFSQQPMVDPYNHPASRQILDGWMTLYNETMPDLITAIQDMHPYDPAAYKTEKSWEKAAQVRAFDILRSMLPVGTTTLLSWHTNLRQARDHLRHLYTHPLEEVRRTAKDIFAQLREKYPHSFNGEEMQDNSERYAARNAYAATQARESHYLATSKALRTLTLDQQESIANGAMIINDKLFEREIINLVESETLGTRPRSAPLPRRLAEYGVYKMWFLLDFGSFRDLQRHRNGSCQIPVMSGKFGFHRWYLDELARLLPNNKFNALKTKIDAQMAAIRNLSSQGIITNELTDQYYYPMGVACLCQLTYNLPQMVYVAELRSAQTVHSSLRPIAQQMGQALADRHPALKLYVDYMPDVWTPKRGEQDIIEKTAISA